MVQLSLYDPPPAWSWDLDEGTDDREGQLRRMGLRYYQREAVHACFDAWTRPEGPDRSTLVVLATGLGKTQVFSAVAALWDKAINGSDRVLVLAHRTELVDQARARLEQMTGEYVEIEQADFHASTRARIVVASVDTIKGLKRLHRFAPDHFGLIVVDECFPAGTLVDGRRIEALKRGDMVRSLDHGTGTWKESRIAHVSSRAYHGRTITLHTGRTMLRCTEDHPVWVKGKGYVPAHRVAPDDVLCVWEVVRGEGAEQLPAAHHLLEGVPEPSALRNDGGYQSRLRLEAHDRPQSHEEGGEPLQDGGDAAGDRAPPPGAEGERDGADLLGEEASRGPWGWLGLEPGDPYADAAWGGLPHLLQAGPREPEAPDLHRGGRPEPRLANATGAGSQERGVLAFARVDRVEVHEPTSPDGERVYNLEVEGTGTYFAEDILVHNCHHYLAKTFRRPLDYFKDAKLLGVTATPDRGDERALGQVFDSVAYVQDIARGIDAGYLVPLRGRQCMLSGLDLDGIKVEKGDLVASQLDDALISHVAGVVQKTVELEPDRQGIAFFPGVKSAELAAERFNVLKPGSAAFVSGATPDQERKAIVRDFRAGRIQYLCNCQVATEGFDAPSCSLIIQARPTKKRAFYAQTVGRGTRTLPGLVEHLDGAENADKRRALVLASAKPDCVILDFVGVGTKHSLIGPEDLLGGEYSEAEIAKAKTLAKEKPGGDTRSYLEQARREMQALAKSIQAKADAHVSEFDPFAAFGLSLSDEEKYASYAAPARPWQVDVLRKKGVDEKDLQGLTKRAANKLLVAVEQRQKEGLCTFKQLRQLARRGVTETRIPFKVAGRAMDYIVSQNWGRAKTFNPAELNRIIAEGMKR